ncbi:DUF4124 domain-containing protein [Pseudoxanthomonas sp.]|uniref:DUF4124 domain-containing protein n=1 Tax=Pseudoxanthomonas sp. TaxID=1871049 RepID=UPI0026191FA0|nr:DUF4124 domain-containing protein [Pseudoxanthomonas sp.]WDS36880.1 MAG: DUF4124 domain-containing protein [Pseudoxanthomonas sp.]
MRLILLLGLCLLTEGAGAQSVYKCRDAAGTVVYQSDACAGITEKQWTTDPNIGATTTERNAAERSIERDRQYLKSSNRVPAARSTRRSHAPRASAPSPCERARQARAAAHERKGVRWSYSDASSWDARVFKVCR